MYYAHSTDKQDRSDWQPLPEHLRSVGWGAKCRAAKFGVPQVALLAGLAHDLGKYSVAFDRRLNGSTKQVDHSTAGAREVMALGAVGTGEERCLAELAAYAIAGHHAGLPDRNGSGSLSVRLNDTVISALDPVWRSEVELGSPGRLPSDFGWHGDKARRPFQIAFLGRMIFSALIDADRRDTEAFSDKTKGKRSDRDWPTLAAVVDEALTRLEQRFAAMGEETLEASEGQRELNAFRDKILEHVRPRAQDGRGLFTLTVPTGGGKTLTVTDFALRHAQRWGFDRIVYAIPFTSVIDQTAAILKAVLGEGLILEHHSAVDFATAKEEVEFRNRSESLDLKLRLAMEDWAAPIVVTTNVQLFESLFSHRPSRCRRLHNLANSVIILDEAQTIPLKVLRPCIAALDELVRNYGCTVVFCTATQPAVALPNFKGGLELGPANELAPDPPALHDKLRRATIRLHPDAMTDDALIEALASVDQGFVVVNSRKHALALYRRAKEAGIDGVVHLTTRQYAAHRQEILSGIKNALGAGRRCRLIATSLIEAGIDLDFEAGWRAMAGLESIVQAAGRVNREGRRAREDSVLTVFVPADDVPQPEIARRAAAMKRLPEKLWADLASPAALTRYFEEVYWQEGDGLDVIAVEEGGRKARRSVLKDCFKLSGRETDFAFRTVGENFRLIESGMVPVIVARDEPPRRALDRLRRENVSAGSVAQALQRYIVQVPPKARVRLIACKHVHFREVGRFGEQFAVLEADSLYREKEGLLWEDDTYLSAEECVL